MTLINTLKLVLLLLVSTFTMNAQDKNSVGVNFMYGAKMFGTQGAYNGVGINYNINTANYASEWTKILNVQNIAIEATLYDMSHISCGDAMTAYNIRFRDQGYFGNHIALSGGIDIRLINTNRFTLLFNPALGVLYSTKDYVTTNGVNQILGCHLNVIGSAKLKLDLPVTYKTHIQIGAGISHCSNSNTSLPNIGLNKIESFIGISQGLSLTNIRAPKFDLCSNAISVELIAGYTGQITTGFYQLNGINLQLDKSFRKETTPIAKAALSLSYTHYLNAVLGIKAGTDVVYSSKTSPLGSVTSDTARFIQTFQGDYTPVYSKFNVGLNAGIDLRLGRFVVSGNYGYYLGGYERYIYKAGGDRFEYGRLFYTTLAAKYFITRQVAIEAKSYLNNFGGLGLQWGF